MMLKLSKNSFSDPREIKTYTKDEILKIKDTLKEFKSKKVEESEINEYIESNLKLSSSVLNIYSEYLERISIFLDSYIFNSEEKEDLGLFYHVKSEILKELNEIIQNLQNANSNCSNIKRLIKNSNVYLNDLISRTIELLRKSNEIASDIINSLKEINIAYEDIIYLWIEINKIKNLNFKLNELPDNLKKWDEFKEFFTFIESLHEVGLKKRKRDKKELLLTVHFDEINQYFLSMNEKDIRFYFDLVYLLDKNKIIETYQGDEFINILERKEVIENLKKFIKPFLKDIVLEKLHDIIIEINELDIREKEIEINSEILKTQKIRIFLPKIVDYYIQGLEKKFQEKIQDIEESEEFEKITSFYYAKIDEFYSKIQKIEDWVLSIETLLKPYENITDPYRKIFSNITSEIVRRKNDYLTFIKTVEDEEIRVDIRKFVSEKISEVNKLIRNYEDEASVIIKEEFPQLKTIREMLNEYSGKIQQIKENVYKRLDSFKTHDIDLYQVIKLWEDNFNRKRQQLTFLISLLINKLLKNFKELLDKEGILFATITEITEQTENFDQLPLNFALSAYLAEKLSEDELKERISELQSKINQLNNSLGLYQVELSKLEKILSNRVRMSKGISRSDVQCTVCHKYINFVKDKIITCPFCASTYHYLCVAFWLSEHNSCPMCQNSFLEPYSEMFENEDNL
ncbi:MAG: hypothetical protein ACFFB0_10370 [Promethearchaeota archaeon]